MARIAKCWFLLLVAAALPCPAAVFIVTNTNDSGAGSFREAISNANTTVNSGGPDEIHFNIAGAGVHTIKPASALPTITDPVVIDGYTQINSSTNTLTNADNAVLLIELNGSAAGAGASGLTINAGSSVVRGLVINGFSAAGIAMYVNGGSLIEGNFIGTDPAGKLAVTNSGDGIAITVPNNLIGGAAPASRNLISGNAQRGIDITGSNVTDVLVEGNFIGTDVSGTNAVPNGFEGVAVFDGTGNVIGTPAPFVSNLISGNGADGVAISGSNCIGNLIMNNFIGTDITGTNYLPNSFGGVSIFAGYSNFVGNADVPFSRNVVSGNRGSGIHISGVHATGNFVQGNFVGTDVTGSRAISNTFDGVNISDGSDNLVGGTNTAARNIISGNGGNGVTITGSNCTGNAVLGNYIGTDVTSTRVLSNSGAGVSLNDASGNLIGGTMAGAGNILSGNGASGVFIGGSAGTATNNLVQGNLIGTDVTGTSALRNAGEGVWIYNGFGNLIGGTNAAARNVISGNGFRGVLIGGGGPLPTGNFVQGNFIGTDVTGTKAIPNLQSGVVASSPSNIVGGAAAGAGNLISGNTVRGVSINAGATNTVVQNNLIGTDTTGTNALPNLNSGVGVFGPGNLIGGTNAAARNIISGNAIHGVTLSGSTANSNLVQGNFIGTDINGLFGLGNRSNGVFVAGGSMNFIGDTSAGAGNLIAFNGLAGVGVGSGTNNAIRANAIFSNSALGIDLLTNGVTANDACDTDIGPNNLQNFPVLTAVTNRVGSTTISGTLNTASSSTFALDFYATLACDPSGFGQGKTFLGSTNVTTDASCNAGFTVTLATPVLTNQFLAATATDTNNNTSEFSACVPIAFDPDANHDGLPDLWQFQYFGCVTCPNAAPTADPDGDGQSNLAEFLAGTDPTDSASSFHITAIAREGNSLRVTWTCGAGRTNMLQTAAGSLTNAFVDLSPQIVLSGAGVVATNLLDIGAATNAAAGYYRVRLVQ